MARLAEYLADLATLLGEKENVHFVALKAGSTSVWSEVEHEAEPKVRERVHSVKRGEGQPEARKAYDSLNRRLAEDNAVGSLVEDPRSDTPNAEPAVVLTFPGKRRFVNLAYGPFSQPGVLQGEVIVIGGEADPVPVHLQDGDTVHICRARRPLAKELARFYLNGPIRVTGNGRWLRNAEGQWEMRSFTILSFLPLRTDSVRAIVERWRDSAPDIPGRDALAELARLRAGGE